MTYELYICHRSFSSWSLRGWLLFDNFGLPYTTRMVGVYEGTKAADMAHLAPSLSLPTLVLPDGTVVGDSLAIAETLHERHPEAGLWPADPAARSRARWLAAEMHSGFTALRGACPMNLDTAWDGFEPAEAVLDDLARLAEVWDAARAATGTTGPWLCGDYSVADAFFAPVAARIAGYGLPVTGFSADYVAAHLADPAFRRWRAMGLARPLANSPYPMQMERRPWPGPAPLKAAPVADGSNCENAACPYSGDPVTDYLMLEGRVFGFCNPFCRDKTVQDPAAWPAFMDIYQS